MIGAQSASSVRYGGELGSFRNVPWWGRPGWFDAAVPERCYGVAVFVIYVASRCILRRGSSRVGLPDLDPRCSLQYFFPYSHEHPPTRHKGHLAGSFQIRKPMWCGIPGLGLNTHRRHKKLETAHGFFGCFEYLEEP